MIKRTKRLFPIDRAMGQRSARLYDPLFLKPMELTVL
jgi:hypothetical protein